MLSHEGRILEGKCRDFTLGVTYNLVASTLTIPLEEFHFARPRTICLAWIVRV